MVYQRALHHYLPSVTIETCGSPISALLRIRSESFAVVLSDLNMPEMNGLRLVRAARTCGSEASFILMTGDSTDDMLTEGAALRHVCITAQAVQPDRIDSAHPASH